VAFVAFATFVTFVFSPFILVAAEGRAALLVSFVSGHHLETADGHGI
jgi:hypothetical protein